MKKLCYFLLFLFIGITSFAQKTEKLPRTPWEDIVLMNTYEGYLINNTKVSPHYSNDVTLKLEGNYTKKDSLAVSQIITKLDSLTETISIKFSKNKKASLKIFFLDTLVRDNRFNNIVSSEGTYDNGKRTSVSLYIYNRDRRKNEIFNFTIQARIAKNLVSGNFPISRRQK